MLTVVRTEPQEAPEGRGFRVAMARPEATEEPGLHGEAAKDNESHFSYQAPGGTGGTGGAGGPGVPAEDLEAKEVAARLVAAAGMAVPREDPDRKAPKAPTVPTANPRGNCR